MTIRTYQYQVQVLVTPSSGTTFTRTAADTSIVNDAVEVSVNAQFLDVDQPIEDLDQFVTWLLDFGGVATVEDELSLTEEVNVFGYEQAEDDLALSDAASYTGPESRSPFHNNILSDQVEYGYLVRTFDIEDDVDLDQQASVTFILTVEDSNILTQEAFHSFVVDDDLNLTQTVSWGYGYNAETDLDLDGVAGVDLVLNQVIVDDEVVEQAMTYFLESRCARHSFNSFHGEGGKEPLDKPLSYRSKFLIQSLDDGTIVQLRNPEMDDRRRYSYNRVNRNYYDNTLDLYADDSWVTEQRQLYTIVATKRDDLDTLWAFLQDNLGREVLIKDWKGQSWIVVVLNPGEVYTEDQEGYWTLDFEVEGERWPGEYVVDFLELTDELSRAGSIYTRQTSDGITFSRGEIANRELTFDLVDDSWVSDSISETVQTP